MTLNTCILNFGEGMNGKRPQFVWEFDSYVPLAKRYGAESVLHKPPSIFDLDYILSAGLGHAYTFGKLKEVVMANSAYAEDYLKIEAAVKHRIQSEWGVSDFEYVRNLGAGQKLQQGVLKILAALALGMDEILLRNLLSHKIRIVTLFGGLTGGTGAAAFLAMRPFLERSGFSSLVCIGGITHVPSVQTRGIVEVHTVHRVAAMLDLVPNMIVFTGLQVTGDDGKNVWDDLQAVTPRVAELLSNVEKLASVHGTTEHMWCNAFNLRQDLVSRWLARLMVEGSHTSIENVRQVLDKYISAGYLTWGNPDVNGFCVLKLHNRQLLQLQHLAELLPVLVYVSTHPVTISGIVKGKGFFGRDTTYEIQLMGSDFVQQILEKAGVGTIKDLHVNGREYTGIAAFEDWLLRYAQDKTWEQAMAYWYDNWVQLAQQYTSWLFGEDICFEPSESVPADTRYLSWVQPKISTMDLTINALGVIGEVEDPREHEKAEQIRMADQKAIETAEKALEQELKKRMSK